MSNTICVSISKEHQDFLDEFQELSPSKLLQASIEEKMENSKLTQTEIRAYIKKIEFLQATINKQRDFIEAKGLMDDFCKDV